MVMSQSLGIYTGQILLDVLHACTSCTAAAKICSAHRIRLELLKPSSLRAMHSVDILPSRQALFLLHYL